MRQKIKFILSYLFLGTYSLQCVQNVMNGHFSFSFITRFLFPLRHVVVRSTNTRGLIIRAKLSSSITIYTQIAKFIGANMGSIWVLSAPDGPHVGPMNFAIRETEPRSYTGANSARTSADIMLHTQINHSLIKKTKLLSYQYFPIIRWRHSKWPTRCCSFS